MGMFYYNPDDPAVTVEKRYGVGLDFNYAHWQAKVFMVVVALLVALAFYFDAQRNPALSAFIAPL